MSETLEPKLTCVPHFRRRYDAFRYGIPMAGVLAFDDQRRKAKRRGIDFLFTLPEWWAWWQVDGRWAQRGIGKDKLVMARKGDAGPYSPENVYCCTHAQNHADVPPAVRSRSQSHRDFSALAARNRERCGAKSHMAKPVITPLGRFACAADAARAHGYHPCYATKKAAAGHGGWRYE